MHYQLLLQEVLESYAQNLREGAIAMQQKIRVRRNPKALRSDDE